MVASRLDFLPPAYTSADPSDISPVGLSISGDPEGNDFLITISPPKQPLDRNSSSPSGDRAPVDFVLVIDVSASMDDLAPVPGEHEKNELTVLDIVKHSVRTIVTSMTPKDRVGIVTFSTSAKVVVPLTRTDEIGKKKAMQVVEGLRTESSTNLWDGLKEGMNMLTSDGASEGSATRLSSVFLLTDGMPNHIPPRGHIPMLKRYIESQPPSKTQFTINTFGFGYSLDSRLLHDIATIGNGTYGFIPDSGMVGTVFVHATANTYATFAHGAEINIELDHANMMEDLGVLGQFETVKSSWGIKVDLGTIQYGQTKDIVVRVPSGLGKANLAAVLNYRAWWTPPGSPPSSTTQVINRSQLSPVITPQLLHHVHRLSFVDAVLSLFPKGDGAPSHLLAASEGISQETIAKTAEKLKTLATMIRVDFNHRTKADTAPYSDALALAKDIEGEVLLALDHSPSSNQALSATNYFSKWGRHYLPSLARCHQRQQCGNFKDVSLQVYGRDSPLFVKSRDDMDSLFDNLPPPIPAAARYAPAPMVLRPPSPPAYPAIGGISPPSNAVISRVPPSSSSIKGHIRSTGSLAGSGTAPPPGTTPPPRSTTPESTTNPNIPKPKPKPTRKSGFFARLFHSRTMSRSLDDGAIARFNLSNPDDRDECLPTPVPYSYGARAGIQPIMQSAPLSPPPLTNSYGLTSPLLPSYHTYQPPISSVASMSSYNRPEAPCFAGHCLIRTPESDQPRTRIDQLKRGVVVLTPSGPRTVASIIRTIIQGGEADMCFVGEGLVVTPWHPIKLRDEKWVFPSQVTQPRRVSCNAVYSILLEPDQNLDAHAVWISGVLCVTLGHGIVQTNGVENDVRAHPFLGDYDKITRSLAKNPEFYNEDCILDSLGTIKSGGSGLVCGFAWQLAPLRASRIEQSDHSKSIVSH